MTSPDRPDVCVRAARTCDIAAVRHLVDTYAPDRRLLGKATVQLYEDVQEFVVAETAGAIIGCGALHVMWEDLAEIRTVAVDPAHTGQGVGRAVVNRLIERGRALGVQRLFCLTFAVGFFQRVGFERISGTPVTPLVYTELLQSEDEGVAEFLDLERVKPNTLGNTRMLLRLPSIDVS
jgi:amino-acid N-acetyltransferase